MHLGLELIKSHLVCSTRESVGGSHCVGLPTENYPGMRALTRNSGEVAIKRKVGGASCGPVSCSKENIPQKHPWVRRVRVVRKEAKIDDSLGVPCNPPGCHVSQRTEYERTENYSTNYAQAPYLGVPKKFQSAPKARQTAHFLAHKRARPFAWGQPFLGEDAGAVHMGELKSAWGTK